MLNYNQGCRGDHGLTIAVKRGAFYLFIAALTDVPFKKGLEVNLVRKFVLDNLSLSCNVWDLEKDILPFRLVSFQKECLCFKIKSSRHHTLI